MDMYHCLVFAVNEQEKINYELAQHFPLLCTFIVRSCDISVKPTVVAHI